MSTPPPSSYWPNQHSVAPQQDPSTPLRKHGEDKDPRYPSPRLLRMWLGWLIDIALHAGVGFAVFLVLRHQPKLAGAAIVFGVLGFFAASLLHRTIVQWICQTTFGKVLVGLVLVHPDTGGRVTYWQLLKMWAATDLIAILFVILIFADSVGWSGGDNVDKHWLIAVRRIDARRLRGGY